MNSLHTKKVQVISMGMTIKTYYPFGSDHKAPKTTIKHVSTKKVA